MAPWVLLIVALLPACSDASASKPGAGGSAGTAGRGAGGSGTAGDGGAGGGSGAAGGAAGAGLRYDQAVFASTHNSYEGQPGDELGTLVSQLDRGVRFVELDVHDNEFGTYGYRIGHDAPGDAALGNGNPNTPLLDAWLGEIASWSASNPGHAPITLGLDLKDSLEDNPSYQTGNLAALNALLETAFGPRLYAAELMGDTFPSIDDLRDRILCVLSGHEGTRIAYRRDRGENPAIAIDAAGRVVEVHDSGSGELWYWTGQLESNGQIRFMRHARYDTGKNPAVALNDAGLLVEVHEDPDLGDEQLWYRVGRLEPSFEISWGASSGQAFPGNDDGNSPSVRFVGPNSVREIHESPSSGQHWYWDGALDPNALTASWTRDPNDGGQTSAPLYDATSASAAGKGVSVTTSSFGPYESSTLLYFTDAGGPWPIRYRQVMFVESQYGGSNALAADAWFVAANANVSAATSWALTARANGKIVRLWQFHQQLTDATPAPSFPATDFPASAWYEQYCLAQGCVAP